jgi:pilus assembly protein CpaC
MARLARRAVLAALLFAPAAMARAQGPQPPQTPRPPTAAAEARTLALEVGAGRIMVLGGPVANVFVADPKVAEVRPASTSTLFVFGVGVGRTTVAALDSAGRLVAQYTVTVQPATFGAGQAQDGIARLLPSSRVKVQADAHGLLLTGVVDTAEDAAQAVALARGYATETQTVDNQIAVRSSIQVTLSVRIAEMDRNVVRQLGVNWQALGNIGQISKVFPALTLNINSSTTACVANAANPLCLGGSFNGVIDALAQDNLVHLLAEPNLTVMSGQRASFLVGGEYPIPVAQQQGAVSIDFKNYGVSLSFIPTVYSDSRINLHVMPEVSQLSNQNSVTVTTSGSTSVIPSLTVRRAESTVELGSGETFAMAGLLQDSVTDSVTALPGLGDIPILGALFRSDAFNRQETELVILVTPYIVRPVTEGAALRLPTDGVGIPSDIERLLLLRQVVPGQAATPVDIPGDAGFVVE